MQEVAAALEASASSEDTFKTALGQVTQLINHYNQDSTQAVTKWDATAWVLS